MTEPDVKLMIRVSPELRQKARIKAAMMGKTLSDLVRECLEQLARDVELPAKEPRGEPKD